MKTESLPPDHEQRLARARISLDGLSVGDAFGDRFFGVGERFFGYPEGVESVISRKLMPKAPWLYSDDTEMALGIWEVLEKFGRINQNELAVVFARRYVHNPRRGYGGTAHDILRSISEGLHWKQASTKAFSGMGSMGNGGAMRVALLGAYFSDDFSAVVREARASAEVTHAQLDGQAGAIAVAVAAAFAWVNREHLNEQTPTRMFECILDHTPKSETRQGLEWASGMPRDLSVVTAASQLGNGSKVISQDTVPFVVWCASRHLNDFCEAMWATVSGLGDRDTTCAMVGGIVALSAGKGAIPEDWIRSREPLQF